MEKKKVKHLQRTVTKGESEIVERQEDFRSQKTKSKIKRTRLPKKEQKKNRKNGDKNATEAGIKFYSL